ncbi:hypothetical protein QCE63_32040 [Caballeronia sp. LZ065]|uniref:hypothetical protein n=1 Tax=Caballeronia sp. LZ065 TaxID=3038571 RepID=UPI00285B2BD3|nr:hypothetical protein [Caballeronia sp. LZ065]MDR5784052.1 hypothetical protein [Caballeronia sp. LZ065]
MFRIRDWRWWVLGICIIGGLAGVAAFGFFIGQWGMAVDRSEWAKERAGYIKRFPEVRTETRNACVAEYEGKVQQLQQQNQQNAQALSDLRSLITDTHDVAQYTLRFLGDRAKLTDARQATLIKQTREAAAAATVAAAKTEVVEQKVNVAASKADEAAITAKAVDKKLETAVHPALPAQPWIGNRR